MVRKILLFFVFIFSIRSAEAAFIAIETSFQIYVAPSGSDQFEGNKEKPLATLSFALRKAREMRRLKSPLINNGIQIILLDGTYHLYEPIFIRPEDSGTAESPTIIEAEHQGKAILSGGITIQNWKKAVAINGLPAGKIWEADAPEIAGEVVNYRQLWVNDTKAIRAKDGNGEQMNRILSWNKKEQTCWIPTPSMDLKNSPTLEMMIHQWWATAILRIKAYEVHGDSTKLSFFQPESRIQSEHPWPAPWISKETGNSAYNLMNAMALLDEPGEWYLDIAKRKIYYWPRNNEDLLTAKVVAPSIETLVKMEGTIDHPVSNISFNGIYFQHTGWLRPSKYGHVPHQTGMYMLDAYKLKIPGTANNQTLENQAWVGRPAAAVVVSFADRIGFENCQFTHLASTGLDFNKAVHASYIKGNLFKDIGGTGILAGIYSDEATEIHLPYNPTDVREVTDKILISNNLISNATNEDWCTVGIGLGYVSNATVEHNEIEDVANTAISMGWGWSPLANAMKNNKVIGNKIHHFGKHNYDCSGIYTLSAQPNSFISENYIDSVYKAPYAHLPAHWFYLYTDEGSSYITVNNNWTPSLKYLQNANGTGNQWLNNGPTVADKIKKEAGLQPNYGWLFKEKSSTINLLPINKERSEVIELVVKEGQTIDLVKLKSILFKNNMDTTAIYQWKNHCVLFGKVQDVTVMQGRLQNNFPQAMVKVYYDMFYQFNRKNCSDKNNALEWDHILLTVNLVADEKLQKEYLNAHATQFEKWPEVSNGFCKASFQQLLIYKNGRQLMLVISIPKGKSLDELNPKTTENNPRVNDWNHMMKKYQTGIEGTKPDETWVFLNKLN
jgi:hypothetical protein